MSFFQFPDQSASYPTLGQRLLLYRHDPHCENILQLIRSPRQICHGDVIEIVLSGKIFHFSFIICFIYKLKCVPVAIFLNFLQFRSFNISFVFYYIKIHFGAPYNIFHNLHLPDDLTNSMRWSLHSRSLFLKITNRGQKLNYVINYSRITLFTFDKAWIYRPWLTMIFNLMKRVYLHAFTESVCLNWFNTNGFS